MNVSTHFRKSEIEAAKHVMTLISADLRAHHSLTDLLKIAGTNGYQLKQIFRTVFKTSIYQFRIAERMEYAKKELANTDKSITEIADELGYGNAEYFSRCFRKTAGISPTEYRKRNNSV